MHDAVKATLLLASVMHCVSSCRSLLTMPTSHQQVLFAMRVLCMRWHLQTSTAYDVLSHGVRARPHHRRRTCHDVSPAWQSGFGSWMGALPEAAICRARMDRFPSDARCRIRSRSYDGALGIGVGCNSTPLHRYCQLHGIEGSKAVHSARHPSQQQQQQY